MENQKRKNTYVNNYKIKLQNVTKVYKIYDKPIDRLIESLSINKNMNLKHKNFYALKDISINVKPGEILGIVGKNGAGKSTLLKIICGILSPTIGEVQVYGRISSLLELGAGFNLEYSGIENIYFYCSIMGLKKEEIDSKIKDILDFAEIGDYINQSVKTYSSGMFARLAFSCAINVEPEILIVDEILSVGDIRFQVKCFNKFKQFKENGITILYVGHDISTMRTFCDTVTWLDNGSIVDSGDPTYITAKYVEYMYTDDKEILRDIDKDDKKTVNQLKNIETDVGEKATSDETHKSTPIAHWGKKIGLIQNVKLLNSGGKEINHIETNEEVQIVFQVNYDSSIDYEYFSVAFSIKDREGVDLIVKSTYDQNINFKDKNKTFIVKFILKTHLTFGDYYLVAAAESRKNTIITYYEYIEGIIYFKVFSTKNLFGRFNPDTRVMMSTL